MRIAAKRAYEPPSAADGLRVLVDRLWPRGLSKATAKVDFWARDLAPSHELRRWYGHDAAKWPEFRRRYFAELEAREQAVEALLRAPGRRKLTLLFAAKEPRLNNAAALRQFLDARGGAAVKRRRKQRD